MGYPFGSLLPVRQRGMMGIREERLARLRRFNAWVRGSDKELAEESADLGRPDIVEVSGHPEVIDRAIELESIVLRRERPVLAIRDNIPKLEFSTATDSQIWKERLERAQPLLEAASRAVGRIELKGGRLDWVGTGWLVADNVMVTNRHVANEFARRKGEGFIFRTGSDGLISASIDFLQEIDNPAMLVFDLGRPLHIEEEPGPDISFFEVEVAGGERTLAKPIDLAAEPAESKNVVTIGYPAYDSRIPEPNLMEDIFGKVYNKKRLAPGAVTRVEAVRLLHNCSTLGGNSGSVVFDFKSGEALGLHFSGSFLATNYAVRSDVVKTFLSDVRSGRTHAGRPARTASPRDVPAESDHSRRSVRGSRIVTVPPTVTMSLGDAARQQPRYASPQTDNGTDSVNGEEAVATDYRDRKGYARDFLGKKYRVELPSVHRKADDVLDFEYGGKPEIVLRYEHFSVVMSRSRRMCFFSAVNIDGNQSKKSARVGWKWDPRIPKSQQIMNECYGNPPKFSRGHMTRREDPGWGRPATAKRGNEDSMHVTNTTPQMQAFNSPIWLALEDYALQHAREDEMKISVFTGPYFGARDPVMYGVRIPLAFWKVIAFIHDETGKLCATGYEMNQKQTLEPEEEFVYGEFTSPHLGTATQVPIRSIEAGCGFNFGALASIDPLAADEEGLGDDGPRAPLWALEQIRFIR
jgi:endonuclease G